jgi:hypothetical protein
LRAIGDYVDSYDYYDDADKAVNCGVFVTVRRFYDGVLLSEAKFDHRKTLNIEEPMRKALKKLHRSRMLFDVRGTDKMMESLIYDERTSEIHLINLETARLHTSDDYGRLDRYIGNKYYRFESEYQYELELVFQIAKEIAHKVGTDRKEARELAAQQGKNVD